MWFVLRRVNPKCKLPLPEEDVEERKKFIRSILKILFLQTEQDLLVFAKEKSSLNRRESRRKRDNQIRNDLNLTNIKDVVRANVVFNEIIYLLEFHVENRN